jgi:hypothetical protein
MSLVKLKWLDWTQSYPECKWLWLLVNKRSKLYKLFGSVPSFISAVCSSRAITYSLFSCAGGSKSSISERSHWYVMSCCDHMVNRQCIGVSIVTPTIASEWMRDQQSFQYKQPTPRLLEVQKKHPHFTMLQLPKLFAFPPAHNHLRVDKLRVANDSFFLDTWPFESQSDWDFW